MIALDLEMGISREQHPHGFAGIATMLGKKLKAPALSRSAK